MFGVDAETEVNFHRLIELCELDFLKKRNSLFQEILLGFDLLLGGLVLFAWFTCHVTSLVQAACKNAQTSH
jgi:hypothetical protein